jgi:hypothetical protein
MFWRFLRLKHNFSVKYHSMKKFITVSLLLSGFCVFAQTLTPAAQPKAEKMLCMDWFAVAPQRLNGAGAGWGLFSHSLSSPFEKAIETRLGGDFFFSTFDRYTLHNVPLSGDRSGLAKVRLGQSLIAFNAAARISAPLSKRIAPYADFFTGLRGLSTNITVTPNEYTVGYEKSSSEVLGSVYSFHYGLTTGAMIRLSPWLRLNAGVLYSYSPEPGSTYQVRTATAETGVLQMQNFAVPKNMVLFKLSFTIVFDANEIKNDCCCCGHSSGSSGPVISNSSGSRGLRSNSVRTVGSIMK